MPKGEFLIENGGQRFDKIVAEKLCITRSHVKDLIDGGQILLENRVVKAGTIVKEGQKVNYDFADALPLEVKGEDIDFEIVYEDDDLIVINKPQGLVVHPCLSTQSGTLVNGLIYKIKNLSGINGVLRPGIVHRLDKNTSGLMIVAKNDLAHNSLAKQISEKKDFQRYYLALCEGHLKNEEGCIEGFISRDKKDRKKMAVSSSGKYAKTNYKVIKRFDKYDLVQFKLDTGRTHQIRVHAKALGHPVVGDDVYGHAVKGLNGQLLHSYKLSFIHPRSQKKMDFEIDLPDYFKKFIERQKSYTNV